MWRWADVGTVCTPDAPAYPLPESLRGSIDPFRTNGRDEWEERAAIGRTIPGGWGGIARRSKAPYTVIYLVDTTQFAAAVPLLVSAGLLPPNPWVGVVKVRWTYAQIYEWFRYIHMHIAGVRLSGWALDESSNRIFYGLEDEAAEVDLGRKLTELHVPCFLVAVRIMGRIQLLSRLGG